MGAPYIYDISRLRVKMIRITLIVFGKQHDVKIRFSVNSITHRVQSRRKSNVRNVIIITSRV